MTGANLPERPLTLMLVCGETSGDLLGAQLMDAVRGLAGTGVRFVGVGGPAMAARGFESVYPMEDVAVMGLADVGPRLRAILRRIREAADLAATVRPDAVVLIDSPEFTHRVARRIRERDPTVPVVNYVAPQLWASRPGRGRRMARYLDLVLALLPFEGPYFEKYGIRVTFVGHPVVERRAGETDPAGFRRTHGIPSDAPVLAVLPGSRANEIRYILPAFRGATEILGRELPGLVTVLPAVSHLAARIRTETAGWPTALRIVEGDTEKFNAFAAADVALAASGTVTTELALAGTPTVVGYRLGLLTAIYAWAIVRVPYVTLVNIILGREAVPEFVQARCRPAPIAAAALRLFRDPEARAAQQRSFASALEAMGLGGEPPSLRAARALLDYVRERQRLSIGT